MDIVLLVFGIVIMMFTACFGTVEYIWGQGVTFKKVFLLIAFCIGILVVVLACIKSEQKQDKVEYYQQKIEYYQQKIEKIKE